jgi:uncharacterized membrane protein
MSSDRALSTQQHAAWRLAVATWIALGLLLVAWEWLLAPVRPGGSWLVLKVVPLLLPLPSMLRGNKDAMQWALLIVLIYLVEATVRMFEPAPYGLLALAELALVCVFFGAAVVYLRPFKQAAKQAQKAAQAAARDAGAPR